MLTGDLQKAFLQVRIKEEERDALRFHWKFKGHSEIETLRFTRALFGLTSSPFLLGGVIQQHFKAWEEREPELVAQIRKSLYVDDQISGAPTVQETQHQKEKATEIFSDAQFTLHKWISNASELEQHDKPDDPDEQSFAKEQLGTKTSDCEVDNCTIQRSNQFHPASRLWRCKLQRGLRRSLCCGQPRVRNNAGSHHF